MNTENTYRLQRPLTTEANQGQSQDNWRPPVTTAKTERSRLGTAWEVAKELSPSCGTVLSMIPIAVGVHGYIKNINNSEDNENDTTALLEIMFAVVMLGCMGPVFLVRNLLNTRTLEKEAQQNVMPTVSGENQFDSVERVEEIARYNTEKTRHTAVSPLKMLESKSLIAGMFILCTLSPALISAAMEEDGIDTLDIIVLLFSGCLLSALGIGLANIVGYCMQAANTAANVKQKLS